jgi:ELWxxDGT repeat protein
MKQLISLTILTLVIVYNAIAQPGFIKYIPYGNSNAQPSGYQVHSDNNLYFSAFHPYLKTLEVWVTDGTTLGKKGIVNANGLFPFFKIIGSKGDSLIMIVHDQLSYHHTEGIFAYNLKDWKLNLIHQHFGLNSEDPLLIENNKVYYSGKTTTGQAIFRYNINTSKTDTFCNIPGDVRYKYLYHFNNKYYLSYEQPDFTIPVLSSNINIIDTINKKLMPQPITPETNNNGTTRMAAINNDVYFVGYTQQYGTELYKYSGSGPATRVTDINPNGSSFGVPFNLVAYNNKIYFSGTDGKEDRSLFEYDPSTGLVKLIYSNHNTAYKFDPRDFYVFHHRLYMTGISIYQQAYQPYVYDGVGTPRLLGKLRVSNGPNSLFPKNYTVYKNGLYFSAEDTFHNVQMYRFDDSVLGPPLNIFEVMPPITVMAYPNPVINNAQLDITITQPQIYSLQLRDINGRIQYSQKQKLYTAGMHAISIPMQQLPAGMYVYSVTDINGIKTYEGKLLKQ